MQALPFHLIGEFFTVIINAGTFPAIYFIFIHLLSSSQTFFEGETPLKGWNSQITDTSPTLSQQTPSKKRKHTKVLPPLRSTTDTGGTAYRSQPPEPLQIHLPCCSVVQNIGRAVRIIAHHMPEQPTTTGVIFPLAQRRRKRKLTSTTIGEGDDTRANTEARADPNLITSGEEMETTKETPEPRRQARITSRDYSPVQRLRHHKPKTHHW
jgi:hypothetical protein